MSSQKVVLITGASSGIGQSIARVLAQKGFMVFGTSRNPHAAEHVPAVEVLPLDVRSDESVKACVDTVLVQAGRLDILVNNAGYVLGGAVEEATIEEARAQFETNFFGTMRTVKAALPILRQQRSGRIINISSLAGLIPGPPFCGIYSASKFALEAYTEHLWREVKRFGIYVSLVEPGSIKTKLTSNRLEVVERLGDYDHWRRRALEAMRRLEEKAPEPTLVADAVLSIIENESPKLRYKVGKDATWIPRLRQVLPGSLFEKQLRKIFDLDAMG
jgi:NAD(P)-dependent dehydrogenase (short-subunit alcohol dehydrogenase family)